MRGVLYLRDRNAVAIKLSISHVFVDGLGRQAATRHLLGLLAGRVEPIFSAPRQSSDFAHGPSEPNIVRSTNYWKQVHADAPRACAFAALRREPRELISGAQINLTSTEAFDFEAACRELGVGPHAAWTAIVSAMVFALSGDASQVFKTTVANRLRRADLSAVAQLAQPVFPRFEGCPNDTLGEWLLRAERSLAAATRHGMYDANALLDWLNHGAGSRGVIFQPAFALNFLPPTSREQAETLYGSPTESSFTETIGIDPYAAKSELAVTIRHFPAPSLRVVARRTISTQITASTIAEYLRMVVRAVIDHPGHLITSLPIPRLPGVAGLITGHASGARVDLAMTRALVLAAARKPANCEIRTAPGGTIHAFLDTACDPGSLRSRMAELLPWFGAAAIPDELAFRGRQI